MDEVIVRGSDVIIIAIVVLWLGDQITRKVTLLNKYSIPIAVTGGLLWLLIDAVRRTDYGLTRSVVAAVVAVHLLGLLVLVDQYWSLRLL